LAIPTRCQVDIEVGRAWSAKSSTAARRRLRRVLGNRLPDGPGHQGDEERPALQARFPCARPAAIRLRHSTSQLFDFSVDDDGNAYIVLGARIRRSELAELVERLRHRRMALLALRSPANRSVGYLHRQGFVHRETRPTI
jgi:hypothetical protein